MEKHPKVLLGGPVSDHHDYCFEEFVKAVKELTYPNLNIFFVDNSKTEDFYKKISKHFPTVRIPYNENVKVRLVESRNLAREKVLKEGYEYLFCLDQDVIPPKDVIERLINYNKDIVSGVYFVYNDENVLVPLIYKKVKKDEVRNLTFEEIKEPNLITVDACGLGCVLISRKVLEKISFRYDPSKEAFDDMWFSLDAVKNGFKIYCDTSVKCKHLIKGRWSWADIKK